MPIGKRAYLSIMLASMIAAPCTVLISSAEAATSAETTISAAAKQNRYTFVTFYKSNDQASTKMLADAKKLQSKLSARASFANVNVADAAHKTLIKRYGVDRSPVPLMLVLAPNGAVTAGFPNVITKTDFSDVFVSKGKAEVLKALQDQKMVFLCAQNSGTKHNKESLAAVNALATDNEHKGKVRIVRVNPSDSKEGKLLKELKLNPKSPEAQVAIIASTGKLAATFSGAVSTSAMISKLKSSCGEISDCGPAG